MCGKSVNMLAYIVFGLCIALSRSDTCTSIPHGHQLKVMVDGSFNNMDVNKDGVLSTEELGYVWLKEDINHDGNLTLAEYAAAWNSTPEFLAPIFHVWDQDGDGYVQGSQLGKYKNFMDPDGDNIVTLHEFEHYMTGFMECAYCHGQHGHGPNCDQ